MSEKNENYETNRDNIKLGFLEKLEINRNTNTIIEEIGICFLQFGIDDSINNFKNSIFCYKEIKNNRNIGINVIHFINCSFI